MTKQLLFNLPLLFLITHEVVEFEGIMTTDKVLAFGKISRYRWPCHGTERKCVRFHLLFKTTITYAISILYKGKCFTGIIPLPFPEEAPVTYVVSLPSLHVVMLLHLHMKMVVEETNKKCLV